MTNLGYRIKTEMQNLAEAISAEREAMAAAIAADYSDAVPEEPIDPAEFDAEVVEE